MEDEHVQDDQALVVQRRLGELEKVYDWPQWRDNPNLDRPTLRDVGRALTLLPEEPSTKQIDILLTMTATDGVSLRGVLPADVVRELLGGRATPYRIDDLVVEFGVDAVFVGSEYARLSGVSGDPEMLIGGTLVAYHNDLDSVEELTGLVDSYRVASKWDDEDTLRWLALHPWSCYEFLKLLERREGEYPAGWENLETLYSSQRYQDGGLDMAAVDEETEDSEID